MKNERSIAPFLRQLAKLIENMSDEQALAFVRSYKPKNTSGPGKMGQDRRLVDQVTVSDKATALTSQLSAALSRESALSVLNEFAPTRAILVEAAKMRSIHVLKADTVSVISNKLVENIVGSRLDSAAIRGRPSGETK